MVAEQQSKTSLVEKKILSIVLLVAVSGELKVVVIGVWMFLDNEIKMDDPSKVMIKSPTFLLLYDFVMVSGD